MSVILALSLAACSKKYKVTISNDYPIANELRETYSAGEEGTIQLATITEHSYALFVNGPKQDMNFTKSGLECTYFVFPLPDEDVLVEIEDHWVNIPEG